MSSTNKTTWSRPSRAKGGAVIMAAFYRPEAVGKSASCRRPLCKADRRQFFIRRLDLDPFDPRGGRALVAARDQGLDCLRCATHQRLDAAVAAVADPAVEAQLPRRLHRPAAIPDALDSAVDAEAALLDHGRRRE